MKKQLSRSSELSNRVTTRHRVTRLVGAYVITHTLRVRCATMWAYCGAYISRTFGQIPKGPKDFVVFFVLEGAQFLILVINNRAMNHLQYTMTAASDALFCFLSWAVWKKIAEAEGWWAKLGYVTGGTTGSLVGMWLTRIWGS